MGRVDLLVGTKVVVEVNSELWHSTAVQRAEDYRRDLALARLGYTVIRVSYDQAMNSRDQVVLAALSAVRSTCTASQSLRHRRSQLRQS